jgi:hypothetical protein
MLHPTFSSEFEKDGSFNNKDFDLLCCDDSNLACVTKETKKTKEPTCFSFGAKPKKFNFDVLVLQDFTGKQTDRIRCPPVGECEILED